MNEAVSVVHTHTYIQNHNVVQYNNKNEERTHLTTTIHTQTAAPFR